MANEPKKGFTWEDADKQAAATAGAPAAGGGKPFVWSDIPETSSGLSSENLAANKARNAQPTQFEQENSGGALDTANRMAGRALSAAGLPTSLSNIPDWAKRTGKALVGPAAGGPSMWQPAINAIHNPTQENVVGAVPVIGAPSVEMSRDVRAGRPLEALSTLAGTMAVPRVAQEVAPGVRAGLSQVADARNLVKDVATKASGHSMTAGVLDRILPESAKTPNFMGGAYEEPPRPTLGPDNPTPAQMRASAKMEVGPPGESVPVSKNPTPGGYTGPASARAAQKAGRITAPSDIPKATIPDVSILPEPRPLREGEKLGYNASTPRDLLLGNAQAGRPGAGEMIQNAGGTVLYAPKAAGIGSSAERLARLRELAGPADKSLSRITLNPVGETGARPIVSPAHQFESSFGPEHQEVGDLAEWETGNREGVRPLKKIISP
jgi:hypothetical protein